MGWSGGKGGMEKVSRGLRTVYFMVALVASLVVQSAAVLVAMGDVFVPCILVQSFTCVRCYSFREHLQRYAFKSSLIDIPFVSIVRSLIIICNANCGSPFSFLFLFFFCLFSVISDNSVFFFRFVALFLFEVFSGSPAQFPSLPDFICFSFHYSANVCPFFSF